jgi:tRNA(fMet)-specific endonuclease VapC
MIYLLDADTLIFMARGLKIIVPRDQRQRERLEMARRIDARCRRCYRDGDVIGLSAIGIAELEYGARHSRDYVGEITAIHKILAPFESFDFDATLCAEHYGLIRQFLEDAGRTIGAMDLLVASHARALGATLVTNNTAHFARVPELRYENWTL